METSFIYSSLRNVYVSINMADANHEQSQLLCLFLCERFSLTWGGCDYIEWISKSSVTNVIRLKKFGWISRHRFLSYRFYREFGSHRTSLYIHTFPIHWILLGPFKRYLNITSYILPSSHNLLHIHKSNILACIKYCCLI